MSNHLNILILSGGTRNCIVHYFKRELGAGGLLAVADCNATAPALYDADLAFVIPRTNDPAYLDAVLSICIDNHISAVLSLIDPELSILALNRQAFLDIGTIPVISPYAAVQLCLNKRAFHDFLVKNCFNAPRCYFRTGDFYQAVDNWAIRYPVVVKPIEGSASINLHRVIARNEIEALFSRFNDLMIQEYLAGTEYGVDVYVDMISGQIAAIFIKEKIQMKAGETFKSVSVKDSRMLDYIIEFVNKLDVRGVIDIDLFKVRGEYYILEVNPRFGGGYPHAYECGVNFPRLIINNLQGIANPSQIGQYEAGIYMMKYSEVKIIRQLAKPQQLPYRLPSDNRPI